MGIPTNIIVIWSGAILDIPEGWFLCDGTNSTPNLRNRFISGAGNNYILSEIGGNKDAQIVEHTHSITLNTAANHTHNNPIGDPSASGNLGFGLIDSTEQRGSSSAGAHSHTISINSTGSSGVNANLPPYYALAYIMYGGE
jgi:microcystin-dependent protein